MKYKFDVIAIFGHKQLSWARAIIDQQLSHVDHINKIVIADIDLESIQSIAAEMDPKQSEKKVAAVHIPTVISGVNSVELEVIKSSGNPVIIIGTPEHMALPALSSLINTLGTDRVTKIYYKNDYSLQFALSYLAILQPIDRPGMVDLIKVSTGSDKPIGMNTVKRINNDPAIMKSTNVYKITRAYELINLGLLANKTKKGIMRSGDAKPYTLESYKSIVPSSKHMDRIIIVPTQHVPSVLELPITDKQHTIVIEITPENATQVTDLIVDSAHGEVKTVGGKFRRLLGKVKGAIFGTESSRRRRSTLKKLKAKMRENLGARETPLHATVGMQAKLVTNLATMKAANTAKLQAYANVFKVGGVKKVSENIAGVRAARLGVNVPLSPEEYRNLEAGRLFFHNIDAHIKQTVDDYENMLETYKKRLQPYLDELDEKLMEAQKQTNKSVQELQAHQIKHGTNIAKTEMALQEKQAEIAAFKTADSKLDELIQSLCTESEGFINEQLNKIAETVPSQGIVVEDLDIFKAKLEAFIHQAASKIGAMNTYKHDYSKFKDAMADFRKTIDMYKGMSEQIKETISRYNDEIVAINTQLNQLRTSTTKLSKQQLQQIATLEALKGQHIKHTQTEDFKLRLMSFVNESFIKLTTIIPEINEIIATRLAGETETKSAIEKLNTELATLRQLLIEHKRLNEARTEAVQQEAAALQKLQNVQAGKHANKPELERLLAEVKGAKAKIPELSEVNTTNIARRKISNITKDINRLEQKLGSISRKRREAKWYQFGAKRTLKREKAGAEGELISLKKARSNIRRKLKTKVI